MTRDKIKQMVANIIYDIEFEDSDGDVCRLTAKELEKAAEEIMKIWDKGFAYEVPNKYYDPPFNIGNCCKNGVCTCGP